MNRDAVEEGFNWSKWGFALTVASLVLAVAFWAWPRNSAGPNESESTPNLQSPTQTPAGDLGSDSAATPGSPEPQDRGLSVDRINVAYFERWPTPNLIGVANGSFDAAVGADINWVPFGTGAEMSSAMEAGEIDISFSQGPSPFAYTTNNGADLTLVGVAVDYSEADNCVAQAALNVTRDNAFEKLAEASVMTPTGNFTHFKMVSMMDHLGVESGSLTILPSSSGSATAAAFEAGDIDVGCAFGVHLLAMIDAGGEPIMTGAEQGAELGIRSYDVVSARTSFSEDHGDAVAAFLSATEHFNRRWAADPDTLNPLIAKAAGLPDVSVYLTGPTSFSFPSLEEQLADAWLGDAVARNMNDMIETFVGLDAIDDFADLVDTSFLEVAISTQD